MHREGGGGRVPGVGVGGPAEVVVGGGDVAVAVRQRVEGLGGFAVVVVDGAGGAGVRVGRGDLVAERVVGRGPDVARGVLEHGLAAVGVVAVGGGVVGAGVAGAVELPQLRLLPARVGDDRSGCAAGRGDGVDLVAERVAGGRDPLVGAVVLVGCGQHTPHGVVGGDGCLRDPRVDGCAEGAVGCGRGVEVGGVGIDDLAVRVVLGVGDQACVRGGVGRGGLLLAQLLQRVVDLVVLAVGQVVAQLLGVSPGRSGGGHVVGVKVVRGGGVRGLGVGGQPDLGQAAEAVVGLGGDLLVDVRAGDRQGTGDVQRDGRLPELRIGRGHRGGQELGPGRVVGGAGGAAHGIGGGGDPAVGVVGHRGRGGPLGRPCGAVPVLE